VPPRVPDNTQDVLAPAGARSDVTFPRLDEEQLEAAVAEGRRFRARQGERLYTAGDLNCELMVVLSGRVAVVDAIDTERQRTITIYGSREFAGELNVVTLEPAYLTAVVLQESEIVALDSEALRRLSSSNQAFGDLILSALVARRAMLVSVESGVRLIGRRDEKSRELRQFLTRNRVPHSFSDFDTDPEAGRLFRDLSVAESELPVLINGAVVLRDPTILQVADSLNLRAQRKTAERTWDIVIVGGGPGGLGAAVYGTTEGLSTILVDSTALGGQAGTSSRIENFFGFPAGISGSELAERALVQARRFGLKTAVPERAERLHPEDGRYVLDLHSGDQLAGRTIVLATGASYRRLPVPGGDLFDGAGVYYAASGVEANMCRGDRVAVVGGGNSAGQAAIFLAAHAERVSLLVRGERLDASMSRYLVDQIEGNERIDVHTSTQVRQLSGADALEAVTVERRGSGGREDLGVKALFVFIGADPCTDWLDGIVRMDHDGFVLTGSNLILSHLDPHSAFGKRPPFPLETSLPGVFAVGDGRSGSIKRVASAVGEGSMAIRLVHEHLAAIEPVETPLPTLVA
jgi:thioredoxin reductase (NADPH)